MTAQADLGMTVFALGRGRDDYLSPLFVKRPAPLWLDTGVIFVSVWALLSIILALSQVKLPFLWLMGTVTVITIIATYFYLRSLKRFRKK